MVSGFTLNLTTSSALLKTDKRVGCPQLALTFTNQVIGRTRLFMHRNVKGDAVPRFPQVDTHLVARVGEYSRKFEEFLKVDVEGDPDLAKAVEAHETAIDKARDVERLCREHFEKIEGFKELEGAIDAQEKKVRRLQKSNRRGNLDADVREADEALRELYRERTELKAANPAPVTQQETTRLRNAEERSKGAVEDAWQRLLHGSKHRKHVLGKYLGQKRVKLTKLPENLMHAIAEHAVELYELETDAVPLPTDARGIPGARLGVVTKEDDKVVYSEMSCACDREVSMPWRHVLTALKPAHLNQLYRPGNRERLFVYAQLDADKPLTDDPVKSVDTLVIGAFPRGKHDVGWALILRNREWIQVIRNIDVIRTSGILEQLLPFWPDESHEKLSTEAPPTAEDEDREEYADPGDAGVEESGTNPAPPTLERSEGGRTEGSDAPADAVEQATSAATSSVN